MSARSRFAADGLRGVMLVVTGLALLVAAWVMASRPFAAPDEEAHYLKALTITNGHLVGPRAPNTLLGVQGTISRLGRRWENRNSRAVTVPARLAPPGTQCQDGRPDVRGSCTESTYTGTYQPLPYLLPAAALGVATSVHSASWLARVASALPSFAFLALALFVLWDGTLLSLVGLLAAVTPMVLFIASVLNPNGLELGANAAFLAAGIRISRAPLDSPRWTWVVLGLSGVVALLSWQVGPAFVAIDLLVLALLLGRGGIAEVWRRRRAGLVSVLAALAGAAALYLAYAVSAPGAKVVVALDKIGDLHGAADQLQPTLAQAVGTFGKLTVPLPAVIRGVWLAVIVLLLTAALAVAANRRRLLLLFACVIAVAFPIAFDALVQRHTGFGLQARYVLAVWMIVPMLSGEFLRSRAGERLAAAVPVDLAVALLALLQLVSWWVNARHSAGRPGAVWFLHGASWSPPLGWWPWLLAAVAGTVLVAAAGVLGAVSEPVHASATGQLPWKRARGN